MALTTRQDILGEIVYRMGLATAITTVTSRRDVINNPYSSDECPAVNVMLGTDSVDELLSQDEHHLPIKLELYVSSESGSDTAEDLFSAIASVVESNPTWGGHADGSGSPQVDASEIFEIGDLISTGTIGFVCHYTTDKGKI